MTDLGQFKVKSGSFLKVSLKCTLAEQSEILGIGIGFMPKYWDFDMIAKSYRTSKSEKLKKLLDFLKSGDTENLVVTFI